MAKPQECYIAKNGVVVDAETAERLGVEDFERCIEPGEAVRRVFGISPERAKKIREEHPAP